MRLLIDLQCAQGTNGSRGIGRSALALTDAIILDCRRRGHDVHLLLNAQFAASTVDLTTRFASVVPRSSIHAFTPPPGVSARSDRSRWLQQAGEAIRAAAIRDVAPDVIVLPSLFESYADDVLTGVKTFEPGIPVVIVLHDLIPYLYPDMYLSDATTREWYERKLGELRSADMLLAVSESSRLDALRELDIPIDRVVNISSAVEPALERLLDSDEPRVAPEQFGLSKPFVMYTGGIDVRKNIEGLITAFSLLPQHVREAHQLAVVCAMNPSAREHLESHVRNVGLGSDSVIFTGFVSDADLVALYRSCACFVFPSLYEGFGLPVLEAMTARRAVIGANTSSIPELIDRDDAMFDPRDSVAMASIIERVLIDDAWRSELESWAHDRVSHFSWQKSATIALDALESLAATGTGPATAPGAHERPRLAYVSPLPPTPSGIAEYSAELLPELAAFYDIDLVVTDLTGDTHGTARETTVADFRRNWSSYDRVVYQFGNSEFHMHMFDLVEDIPGVVVLHDFFLSGVIAHSDAHGHRSGSFHRELYRSHGYAALLEHQAKGDGLWRYPANFSVIHAADGVIVHSEFCRHLTELWYGASAIDHVTKIPLAQRASDRRDRFESRRSLGIDSDDFVVCSFGVLGPTKLNFELIEAIESSTLADDVRVKVYFVGTDDTGEYGRLLQARIESLAPSLGARVVRTGGVDPETYALFMDSADIAVQLRTMSRGESSRSILDCMGHRIPVVFNMNGSNAELPSDVAYSIADEFEPRDLVAALEALRGDHVLRNRLADAGEHYVRTFHDPASCARQYVVAIEQFCGSGARGTTAAVNMVASIDDKPRDSDEVRDVAKAITRSNLSSPLRQRQILVDVSELIRHDIQTGIQRVTKNILRRLLTSPPVGYRVEPVYATEHTGYRYARAFTTRLLSAPSLDIDDEFIDYGDGDHFLGLDLQPYVVPAQRQAFADMRAAGVSVQFVLYDLLPLRHPEFYPPEADTMYRRWLDVATESDGLIAISRAVADDVREWMSTEAPNHIQRLQVRSFQLGADFSVDNPTRGYGPNSPRLFRQIAARPTFLMVGTIEPRKGHGQVLAAFERLWAAGHDLNLVIVGKEGWLVGELVTRIRQSPEIDRRLHWVAGASDEYLSAIYEHADSLIAASLNEGFGLPLVEAYQHGLDVIARDTAVFREVADGFATFFAGDDPAAIRLAIQSWLERASAQPHRPIVGANLTSWDESVEQLLACVLGTE